MALVRDVANALVHRGTMASLKVRNYLHTNMKLLPTYHPNPFEREASANTADPRDTQKRTQAILNHLPNEPLSVLDIGCSSGYFTFKLAERGGFCLGVDCARNQIMLAKGRASVNQIPNVAFAEMLLTEDKILTLPKVDAVICLSVFHHWARKFGLPKATEYMKNLASRCEKYLVFDTGQPDETEASWASQLDFMQPDIDKWIQNYLTELGFSSVKNLGEYKSLVSETKRHLYIASK